MTFKTLNLQLNSMLGATLLCLGYVHKLFTPPPTATTLTPPTHGNCPVHRVSTQVGKYQELRKSAHRHLPRILRYSCKTFIRVHLKHARNSCKTFIRVHLKHARNSCKTFIGVHEIDAWCQEGPFTSRFI